MTESGKTAMIQSVKPKHMLREAVEYLADLYEGIYDTNVFEVLCVTRIKETM